jgi:pectate lyase
MRPRNLFRTALCVAIAGAVTAVMPAANASTGTVSTAASPASPTALAIARQVLPANDGWAALDGGTTGGSAADEAHVFVARTRAELVTALGGDNVTNGTNAVPKIVFIADGIEGNVDDANQPLTCANYADPGWSLDAFLAAYDPAVWGRATRPTGPLEDARVRSTRNQGARININVGPNTTIVGLKGAKLTGINLLLNRVNNVIVRNLRFEDASDCFPSWDPTDGALGNWNSLYDTVTLSTATHVWVDHSTFSDGNNRDSSQPTYFGRPYQNHDGALDIIRASDLVTVSNNWFLDHDKTMLIGSSNTVGADVGKLRVTLHHNKWHNVGQRAPRVRFGQVDLYDNYFVATDEDTYSYSWGVGVFATMYAENNFVLRSADVALDAIVFDWRGTAPGALTEVGTLARVGTGPITPTNLLANYNATHDPDITTDAGWIPALRAGPLTATIDVPAYVNAHAGAGKLGI